MLAIIMFLASLNSDRPVESFRDMQGNQHVRYGKANQTRKAHNAWNTLNFRPNGVEIKPLAKHF